MLTIDEDDATQECSEISGTATGCNLMISQGLLLHIINGTRKWLERKYHDSLQIVDKRVRYSRSSFFSPLPVQTRLSVTFVLYYEMKYVYFILLDITDARFARAI